MRCDDCREALSARIDGEALPPAFGPAVVDAHLAGCPACQEWEAAAVRVSRAVRLQPAESVPDLWPAVRDASGVGPPAAEKLRWARVLLAAVALTQLVLAVPAMVLGHDHGHTTHLAREVGAFDIALAVGFAYAALRPRHVGALVPFMAALVASHVVAASVDLALGRTGAPRESTHVLEIAGLLLLWLLSHGGNSRVRRDRTHAA